MEKLGTIIGILIFMGHGFSQTLGERYWYRKSNKFQNQCQCNYTEVFTELPYILQELGRNENFHWTFQGKKGDRGFDGPEGPAGLPGRSGTAGAKGERGEPGLRGLPGTSLVFNPKGSLFGSGEKGGPGARGANGKKGQKGENGISFTTVLKDGSYIQVKGTKGERGNRGRLGKKGEPGDIGLPGKQGLSIQGQKGEKGEPVILPDIDLLRGLPGPRGPTGLPGYPGLGCGKSIDADNMKSTCGSPTPIVIQRKGDKGSPGVSLMGEKGEVGTQGPPGLPGTIPENILRTYIFKSEREMLLQTQIAESAIGVIAGEDRAYIMLSTGWKEIVLGSLLSKTHSEASDKKFFRNSQDPPNSIPSAYENEGRPKKVFFLEHKSLEKNKYNSRRYPARNGGREGSALGSH